MSNSPGNLKVWIWAIRPKTLILSQLPVITGLALALTQLKGIFLPRPLALFLCSLLAMLMQAAANLVNDAHDSETGRDRADRLGPLRVTQAGLLAAKTVKQMATFLLGISFLLGLILVTWGGFPLFLLGVVSLFTAYAYTGGPYPLSHLGLGEAVAYLFFGPLATWGTAILQAPQVDAHLLFFMGHLPGTAAALLMLVNNLRDYPQDAHSQWGKKTLVVRWGPGPARILLVCLLSSVTLVCFSFGLLLAGLIPLFFWSTWLLLLREDPSPRYNRSLGQVALCFLLTILCFSWGIVQRSLP